MKTDRRIGAVIVVLAVAAGASAETDDEFVREPRGFVEKSSQYDLQPSGWSLETCLGPEAAQPAGRTPASRPWPEC